jgi:hypothetical protein
MIVNFFKIGSSSCTEHIDYLTDEEKHEVCKPEILKGSASLTKEIINEMSQKNKFTAGVIAFRENENVSKKMMLSIIEDFEATFTQLENGRVNFYWVLHQDKNKIELHFVSPKLDLKTDKAFNIYVPGKPNEIFFEHWTRRKNYQLGFKQVDNKEYKKSDYDYSTKLENDLSEKRRSYNLSRFYKAKKTVKIKITTKKGVKNGMEKHTATNKVIESNSNKSTRKNQSIRTNSINNERISARRESNDFEYSKANQSDKQETRRESIGNGTANSKTVRNEILSNEKSISKNENVSNLFLKGSAIQIQINKLISDMNTESNPLKILWIQHQLWLLRIQQEQEQTQQLEANRKMMNQLIPKI